MNARPVPDAEDNTLRGWLATWLHAHYPDPKVIDTDAARRDSLSDLPTRFIPALGGLLKVWWGPAFARIAKSLGYGFIEREVREVATTPRQEVVVFPDLPPVSPRVRRQMSMGQMALWSWDDLALWAIQNFRRIEQDREAIRQGIIEWSTAHPAVPVDIDAAMMEFEQKARSAA
jgi:hypothetical protein